MSTERQKDSQQHRRVGGDAVGCFLIEIVRSLRRRESCRNSPRKFAGISCIAMLSYVDESLARIAECAIQKYQSGKASYAKKIQQSL